MKKPVDGWGTATPSNERTVIFPSACELKTVPADLLPKINDGDLTPQQAALVEAGAAEVLANLSAERLADGQTKKYGNRKVEAFGYTFASKKEYAEYMRLRLFEKSGVIAGLRPHPVYPLVVNDVLVYTYTADFEYFEDGVRVVVDVKSVATRKKDTWRVVKKLFRALYGFDITER
jgi:hypothetical protein